MYNFIIKYKLLYHLIFCNEHKLKKLEDDNEYPVADFEINFRRRHFFTAIKTGYFFYYSIDGDSIQPTGGTFLQIHHC